MCRSSGLDASPESSGHPQIPSALLWSSRRMAAVNRASARRVSESNDWTEMGRPRVMVEVARSERVPVGEKAGKGYQGNMRRGAGRAHLLDAVPATVSHRVDGLPGLVWSCSFRSQRVEASAPSPYGEMPACLGWGERGVGI
jgi:hypothetical protein